MTNHSINRQVFELDYAPGSIAGDVQKQLLHYTAPALQTIIGNMLDELADGHNFYRIDRLEIDLGDITKDDFGLPDMLDRFRAVCRERLTKLLHDAGEGRAGTHAYGQQPSFGGNRSLGEKHSSGKKWAAGTDGFIRREASGKAQASGGDHVSGVEQASGMLSAADSEWEMCRIFLLTGDLPWWADKSSLPDMNRLLKKLILARPVQVRSFLDGQGEGSDVWRRIRWQYKTDTLKLLDQLLAPAAYSTGVRSGEQWPGKMGEAFSAERSFPMELRPYWEESGYRRVKDRLAVLLHRKKTAYGNIYRTRALGKLINAKSPGWLAWLKLLAAVRNDAFSRPGSLIGEDDKKNMEVSGQIAAALKSLTTFQLAFLLEVAGGSVSNPGKEALVTGKEMPFQGKDISLLPEVPPLAGKEELRQGKEELLRGKGMQADRGNEDGYNGEIASPAKKAAALAIAGRLGLRGAEVIKALLRWPENVLLALLKKAYRMERVVMEAKEMSRRLLQRPHVLAWLLLHAHEVLRGSGKKANKELGLQDWKKGERIVLEDIFHKGGLGTTNEKKLIVRCVKRLPEPAIHMLDLLAGLPEEEIKELLSSGSPITTIKEKEHEGEEMQRVLVENAGLCLLAPYFTHFFKNLGYMENDRWKNIRYACKAIHLLQYIASGQVGGPGYLLPFNKLLCGLLPGDVIPGTVRLSKKELAEADGLIDFIISNWKALKNTSLDGLRGSFLCRKGILRDMGSHHLLQVERREYDILLSGVSWGYSIIKLPWMKQYIQVEW